MTASSAVPVHPLGPKICTCRWLGQSDSTSQWNYDEFTKFMCDASIDGEDGLCAGCRKNCARQRAQVRAFESHHLQEVTA